MWTRLLHPASDQDGVSDSVLTLTAIILLLRPLDVWWVAPFVLALACLSLVLRPVRRAPITWLLVAALVAVRIAVVWPLSDNHIYLLAYWCLAIGLALSGPDAGSHAVHEQPLASGCGFRAGRPVEGGAVARLHRRPLLPGDAADRRAVRRCVAGVRRAVAGSDGPEPSVPGAAAGRSGAAQPPAFVEPPRLRAFAAAATWGGLILEALVALLNLMPAGGRIQVARHAALLAFCATTYALAPVAGFGWLLATMGLAQCRTNQRALHGAYVAVFVLILLYTEVPWTGVLADWIGR